MNYKFLFKAIILCVSLLFIKCTDKKDKTALTLHYPAIQTISQTDVYYGNKVQDEYRFLEYTNSAEVKQWINAENKLCDSVLNHISGRDTLKKLLEDAVYSSNIRGGFPRAADKKLFYFRIFTREGIQKLFYRDSLNSNEIELFSTASVNSEKEIFNIDYYEPSYDGKYLAFGISSNGNEMTVIKIIDVEKKQLLSESITRTTYGTPYWVWGKNAFFYNQLKEPKSDTDLSTLYENSKVKLHYVGTDTKSDQDIFSSHSNKKLGLQNIDFSSICTFPGSDKVVAYTANGSSSFLKLRYTNLQNIFTSPNSEKISWVTICDADEKVLSFALNGNIVYTISFKNSTNGCLKKYNLATPDAKPIILLEEKEGIIEDLMQTKNVLYIKILKNGINFILKMDFATENISPIELPYKGCVNLKMPSNGAPSSYLYSDELFFAMQSWNVEKSIYRYNPASNKVYKTDLRPQGKYSNLENIVVEETEVKSNDGTLIPLSIIYMKGIQLNGKNPTLLEGYGAYGVSMDAVFSSTCLAWLNLGGIYAVAHVRGGGEKGEAWHMAGYKIKKPNSWKDFIACSEYLISKGYTSTNKLAALGVSAGGITVGRAITERPDLYKAAILNVSELNTVRSENSNNTFGISEFGTTKDSLDFTALYDMDTYHHIKEKINYPALLLTAGLNDVRVDWWQPAKAVARFQSVAKNNVILFKINDSGHGGDPDEIKEQTDFYSFLFWQLNHPKFIFR